ncbi:MAG: DUF4402 domain-containing protein, partial [Bacteroidota bacterium]
MKKLLILLLIIAEESTSFAQQWWQASSTVSVTVRVLPSLALTTSSPRFPGVGQSSIDFGLATQNDSRTIDPNSSNSAVQFTATGAQGVRIHVTYSYTQLMEQNGGSSAISWTPNLVGSPSNSQPDARLGRAVHDGDWVTLSGTFPGLDGKYYFWLGGSLTTGPNQEAGNYVGTFTLTVSY